MTLPQIDGQAGSPTPVVSGPPMDALASFDINKDVVANNTVVENSASLGPRPAQATVVNNVVTPETKSEVISRPVIRTRVNKNDPQSAEKEAAAIRGVGNGGAKSSIKKRHEVE